MDGQQGEQKQGAPGPDQRQQNAEHAPRTVGHQGRQQLLTEHRQQHQQHDGREQEGGDGPKAWDAEQQAQHDQGAQQLRQDQAELVLPGSGRRQPDQQKQRQAPSTQGQQLPGEGPAKDLGLQHQPRRGHHQAQDQQSNGSQPPEVHQKVERGGGETDQQAQRRQGHHQTPFTCFQRHPCRMSPRRRRSVNGTRTVGLAGPRRQPHQATHSGAITPADNNRQRQGDRQ